LEIKYKDKIFIYDFESITPEIDQAFQEFYSAAIKDHLDTTAIDKTHLPKLEELSIPYLREHSDVETTRKYFKNLRLIWALLHKEERLFECEVFLQRTLKPIIHELEEQGIKIHKGPIYYFWGGTALLQADLDRGFLLMHSAYQEEMRINEPQPTPSFKFVSLNFTDNQQYFGFLVRMFAEHLWKFINRYNWIKKSQYSLGEFQSDFLVSNPSPDIVFSFTYTLARLHQLSLYSSHYLNSGFAGQYKLNLLFDLTLVIENALRVKHPNYGKNDLHFPILVEYLSNSLSWNLKAGHLGGYIKQEAEKNYDQCLLGLLEREFPFKHPISNRDLECDIGLAYLIRNRGAHDLTSSYVVTLRFDDLLQSIFNVLFLVTQNLYK